MVSVKRLIKWLLPYGIVRFIQRKEITRIMDEIKFLHRNREVFIFNKLHFQRKWLKTYMLLSRKVGFSDEWLKGLLSEIYESKYQLKKNLGFKNEKNGVLVLSMIRNDIIRLKEFLKHYRNLGIRQFAFIDDQSDDGTYEYLMEQKDAEVFRFNKRYAAPHVQDAWINHLLHYYGPKRWYLVADSDELLVYANSENRTFDTFINGLEKNKINSVRGMMVDMYPQKPLERIRQCESAYKDFCYFDKSGYKGELENRITGGMRERCFGVATTLTKTPLFKFSYNEIYWEPHRLYEVEKNKGLLGYIAILHYKFMAEDLERFNERVIQKNMFDNSVEYITYAKGLEREIGFYDENFSVKYENSYSLYKYGLLRQTAYTRPGSRFNPRPLLRFDVHLADHCNLNCSGCEHFSSLASKKYLGIDGYTEDCRRLAELSGGLIEDISLLGGEPLLNPEIEKIIEITRSYFHTGMIRIITNGVLLEKQPVSFWESLKRNNISLYISVYPIKVNHKKIQDLCHEYGIELVYWGNVEELTKDWRTMPIDLDGNQNCKESFYNCYAANYCFQLVNGKLFPCFRIAYIRYFNNHFGVDLKTSDKDYIDLHKAQSMEEILDFLSKPVPFCRYCNMKDIKEVKWSRTGKRLEEWV